MRRRKQKNTLLPKMIGIAILINAILLPILAQLGAFKSVTGHHLIEVSLVKLPPLPKPPPEKKTQAKKQTPKTHQVAKAPGHSTPSKALPPVANQPHIAIAQGNAGDGDTGATQGNGAVGVVPPAPTPTPAPPAPIISTPPPPVPTPAPVIAPPPPAPAPVPPHVPVVVAAVPLDRPEPTVPDDLRDQDVSGSFLALFTINPDGSASVKELHGTGNDKLDDIALDAAKRWTFRPATQDGKPVSSYLRLQVDFATED